MFILRNKILLSFLATFISIIAIAQTPTPTPSQTEPEPPAEELKQFAKAVMKVQEINQNLQSEMVEVIQTEGLDVERYNEIMQSQSNPDAEISQSESEKESFAKVNTKIEEIRIEGEKEMVSNIEDAGLTVNRYQEIAATVQKNPELQQKIQGYIEQ